MKYISLLALSFVMFGVTACGTVKGTAKDIQIVGENIGAVATGDVVPAYDEEGNRQFSIGRMPEGYNYDDNPADHLKAASHNQRVDLYYPDTGEMARSSTPSVMTMPTYSGGMATSDSSVTIYPLNQEMENVYRRYSPPQYQEMNNQGYMPRDYAPQSYAPILPDMNMGGEGQIYFKHGSSRLGGGDLKKISAVARSAAGPVTVEGYASRPTQAGQQSVQASILNLKESMNRSYAVSKELLKKGVPADNIKTVSYGSAKASGNAAQDRRVDIVAGY